MNLLRKLFPPATLPESARTALQSESIRALHEKIRIKVVYRDFRGPGMRSHYRSELTAGSIAITSKRVAAFARRRTIIDVPYNHPSFQTGSFTAPKAGSLVAAFDPSVFSPDQSGRVELHFRVPDAARLMASIKEGIAQQPDRPA